MPVSLAERLRESIRREGAVTFHDWMKAALYDPVGGYYLRSDRERWGREGDYRTSPERSDLFGATFARYFAKLYDELQRPQEWSIVEGGAGNGQFAAGVLRTLAQEFAAVFNVTRYVVCELSDDAQQRARASLSEFADRVVFDRDWNLTGGSGIYFSNELLDSFPVHRVVKHHEELCELYVSLDSNNNFAWSNGSLSTQRLAQFCDDYSVELAEGQVIEINLEIDDWMAQIAARLPNGFLVTVDYGAAADELYDSVLRPNGTLRAFSRHEFVDDVLAQPGACDITASVNWTQVKSVGKRHGFEVVEFAPQDRFLLNAGLLAELEQRLARAETEAEKASLTTGAREMILPGGISSSFQILVQQKGVVDVA